MRRAIVLLALMLLAGAAPWGASAQTPFRAVAEVNGAAITAWDVDQRARILRITGQGDGADRAVANAALERLVENRLMLQEGEKLGIEPTAERIEEGIAELARRSGVTPAAFRARMAETGVSRQALEDMVGAQMVWRDVVRQRFMDRVEPSDAEIDAEIALADEGSGAGTTAVALREIGLPLTDEGRSEAETRALAASLVARLRDGGGFAEAVRRYSRSPSAEEAGRVGWVDLASLPPEIAGALAGLDPGGITDPLRVEGGYSILQVVDRRAEAAGGIDAADPELRDRVRRGMVGDRLDRLSRGLLQGLRRDALIQIR